VRVHGIENPLAVHVPMIMGPAPYERVEPLYQHPRRNLQARLHDASDALTKGFLPPLRWLDEQFALVLAHVLAQEVNPLLDMDNPGFLLSD